MTTERPKASMSWFRKSGTPCSSFVSVDFRARPLSDTLPSAIDDLFSVRNDEIAEHRGHRF